MSTLKLKPGMKVIELELFEQGFQRLRKMKTTRELLDSVAATIANRAEDNKDRLDAKYSESGERGHEVDGGYSKGRQSRYRASVRTASNEAVRSEAHHQTLTSAFETVVRRQQG